MKKRLFAVLLTVAMCLSLLPMSVLAAYGDVAENEWYADAVDYVTEQGMMNGVGDENFDPEGTLTRAMLVTILWRMEGSPAAGPNTFTDVPNGEWYTQAIAWAAANGIVEGYGSGLFGPTDEITREQLATILYRYAGMKGENMETDKDLADFPDGTAVSSWAQEAMVWAVARGLISGDDNGNLDAQGDATRAQTAMILYRFGTTPEVTPPAEETPEEEQKPSSGGGGGGSSHSHSYTESVTKEATCTEKGEKTFTCRCGSTYTEEIPALGHAYTDAAVTKAATCTATGEQTYTCTRCSETIKEDIPANGHTAEVDAEIAPTCTESGLSEGSHCSVCYAVIVAQETVAATGHDWEWKYNEAEHWKDCKNCDAIQATAFHSYADGTSCTDAADCTGNCGYTKAAGEHQYGGTPSATTPATCTTEGKETYSCTQCQGDGNAKEVTIPALGHKFTQDKWTHDSDAGTHSRTCENSGCTEKETVACTFSGTWSISGTAGEGSTQHERTCSATGCTNKQTENHTYSFSVSEDQTKGTFTCQVCGNSYTKTYVAKLAGATTADGYFETIADAQAAAAGKTLMLLAEEQTVTVAADATYTINANGKTVTLNYANMADVKILKAGSDKVTATADGKTLVFDGAADANGLLVVAAAYTTKVASALTWCNTIDIYTADGMVWFNTATLGDNEARKSTVTLMNDIDMTGKAWTTRNLVMATFDGNGNTISNLTCTQETGYGRGGLFGSIGGSTIKNLIIDGLTAEGAQVAAIGGNGQGGATISGITLKGSINLTWAQNPKVDENTYQEAAGSIGAILGVHQGETVSDITIAEGCTVTLDMTALTETECISSTYGYVTGYQLDGATEVSATNSGTVIIIRDGFKESITSNSASYEVSNAKGLVYFAETVNAGDTYAGDTVKLTGDIDLNNTALTINNFAGTFDGQGYTISNMTANLFGTVSGTVKDLNVTGVTVVNTAKNGANGFIGTVAEGGLVDNCTVSSVDIKWAAGIEPNNKGTIDIADCYGGVISRVSAGAAVQNCEFSNITMSAYGYVKRSSAVFAEVTGEISGCTIDGVSLTVTNNYSGSASLNQVGGIIADLYAGSEVSDCTISNVTVTADKGTNAGGIVGKAYVTGTVGPCEITLKNITVNGLKVTAGNTTQTEATVKNVGGFIGQMDSRYNDSHLTMNNCHITGLDMTTASAKKGEDPSAGFISSLNGGADITNCSVSGKIDGTNEFIGIGGFLGCVGGYGANNDYVVNITGCSADVAITGNNDIFVGGFVAYAGSYNQTMTKKLALNFTNCEATGSFYGQLETGTNEVSTFTGCKVDGAAFDG